MTKKKKIYICTIEAPIINIIIETRTYKSVVRIFFALISRRTNQNGDFPFVVCRGGDKLHGALVVSHGTLKFLPLNHYYNYSSNDKLMFLKLGIIYFLNIFTMYFIYLNGHNRQNPSLGRGVYLIYCMLG